jgi:hypothetical protein
MTMSKTLPARLALARLALAFVASAAFASDCCPLDRRSQPCRVESIVARALGASPLFAIEPCACDDLSPQSCQHRYVWLWAW